MLACPDSACIMAMSVGSKLEDDCRASSRESQCETCQGFPETLLGGAPTAPAGMASSSTAEYNIQIAARFMHLRTSFHDWQVTLCGRNRCFMKGKRRSL